MPLQGVTNGCALTQGVASLALGYALVGLSARPCLNPKLQFIYCIKVNTLLSQRHSILALIICALCCVEYSRKGRFQKDSLGFLPFLLFSLYFSLAQLSHSCFLAQPSCPQVFSEPTFIQLLISRGLFPVIVIMNLYVIIEYDSNVQCLMFSV